MLWVSLVLFSTLSAGYSHTPSAGNCGPTSVSTVPGCWGVPGCAYVIASDLGPGAACSYDYCNCGGTNVPLLPETRSGKKTIGCASYTIQPTKNACPTAASTVPSLGDSSTERGSAAPSGPPGKSTPARDVRTLTEPGHGLVTLTLPLGSSITDLTTLTTEGSTLTISPTSPLDSVSNLETLTDHKGSTVTLTLSQHSSITGFTTVITDGSTITFAPLHATAASISPAVSIVVDGSTLSLPSSPETITQKDGSTLVVGPSFIAEGSNTVTIPTGRTTITTRGATFTFDASKKTPGPSHTTAASATRIESAKSATGSPAITPPPAGSPGAIPTSFPQSGSKQSQVAITFGEETYILPHTVSVEILQSDGSFLTLFSDSVVSGTATVSVPLVSTHTGLSSGGLSLRAGPEPPGLPAGGGASGFVGLINALESLASDANAIVNTLDKIGHQAVLWSSGSLGDSAFASGVGGFVDSVTSDLSTFASTISSTLDTYESEVYEMTDDGLRRVFPARTGAVEEFDLLNSLRKLFRDIPTFRNDVVLKVKGYWKQGTAAAAALAAAEEALRNFGGYDWGNEKHKHTSLVSTKTTSTATMSSEIPSTTTSSKNSATPTLYWFRTKDGTDLSTFESYIKTLPDSGQGEKMVFEHLPWQTYMTNLTVAQAEEVKTKEFILFVKPVIAIDTGSFGAIPPNQKFEKRINDQIDLQARSNSDQHLSIISQEKDAPLSDYLFDPLLGRGQTIYILDAGFNINHQQLVGGDREVNTYVVPNRYTLGKSEKNQNLWAPEDITDYDGHGTMVASVAAGVTHGVASNANLFLIKFKQATKNPIGGGSGRWIYRQTTDIALENAFDVIINHVLGRRREGEGGKSIVNLSYGFTVSTAGGQQNLDDMRGLLNRALSYCWEHDIITVVAAGNDGAQGMSLDRVTPPNIGTTSNGLITVGGVDANGILAARTNLDAGRGGSLTVYAVSENVVGADWQDNDGSRTDSGTSFAAPAVAGLAAYFASLPALDNEWEKDHVATDMKRYITKYAYQRSANPIPANLPSRYSPRPPANSIIVAYNRAPEGLCSTNTPHRRAINVRSMSTVTKGQAFSGDFDVVVSGTIVVSSLTKSYCYNTNFPTLPSASYCTEILSNGREILHTKTDSTCTYHTVEPTTTKTASPAPTVNTDQGILTCGTRTDQGHGTDWFTPGDAFHAIWAFCGNMTNNATPIVFKPGSDTYKWGLYTQPDNSISPPIRVSAKWKALGDSGCPTLNFSHNTNDVAFDLCKQRLNIAINDCDTKDKNGANRWKQGGKFFRDCITWEITSNPQ